MKAGQKVVAYLRVSTVGQAENGSGLDVQEETIGEFCQAQGFELAEVFVESGVSGGNGIADRVALPKLLDRLDQGDVAGVVIARLDRLARDIMLQETILASLRGRGAELVSVAEPDLDSQEPTRKMVRQMLGVISEYEKDTIVGRLTAGRRRKTRAGGFAGHWIPLGYRVNGAGREAMVIVDRETAPVVERIFRQYAAGLSMRDLATQLQEDQVPTVRGGAWRQATVGAILANRAYTGEDFPAIVTRQLFERCERRRKKARKR